MAHSAWVLKSTVFVTPTRQKSCFFPGSMPSLSQALHPLLTPILSLAAIRLLARAAARFGPCSQGNLTSAACSSFEDVTQDPLQNIPH